jgi:hypothetical protein
MRHLFALSLSAVVVSTVAAAAPAPEESWGKAGVSLARYRQDAIDCAVQGYALDISNSQDAKEFVRASRELDNIPGGVITTTNAGVPGANSVNVMSDWAGMQQHIIDSIRPDERFKSIKQMQVAATDRCLVSRGYSKFRLTEEQRRRLRKLKFGSDERRVYLYRLASSPVVLTTQRAPAEPSATR